MSGTRQNIQQVLALEPKGRGEAPAAVTKGPNHSWRSRYPKARPAQNN